MMDQAEKLRSIINKLNDLNSKKSMQDSGNNNNSEVSMKQKTKVITVTSGKGGVGKTNLSVNLALLLSELGNRVIVVDADLGLANVDVMLGIMPEYTLLDVVKDDKEISDILMQGPNNIKFISGGSGVEELIKLERWQLDKFMEKMSELDELADVIIIDTGAGVSDNVLSFIMAADEIILIATPEPTSITDAYALIKTVSKMDNTKDLNVVVNRADNKEEAEQILKKLTLASEKFLSFEIESLGYILNDDVIKKAVKQQQPFILSYPKSSASKQIKEITKKLVKNNSSDNESQNTSGFKGFIGKLMKFLNT